MPETARVVHIRSMIGFLKRDSLALNVQVLRRETRMEVRWWVLKEPPMGQAHLLGLIMLNLLASAVLQTFLSGDTARLLMRSHKE